MLTLTLTDNLKLPYSIRTYIDSYASEYKRVDPWAKICHIAYCIKRGANLLPAFIEDIKDHLENPAYYNYEELAKTSIATYIEMLRTNCEQDTSIQKLPAKLRFSELFQLLTEEILYRYWELEIDQDQIECKFDKTYFNYEEINARFKNSKNPTREFIKYIATSKETLRNIDLDEENIRHKNGWKAVSENMYGLTVWSDKEEDERIYPGDAQLIHKFNETAKQEDKYIVGVPPMPFSGNLLKSKVIILTLNPGYVEAVNKDKCDAMHGHEKEQLLCLMRNALELNGYGIYDSYECSRVQGDYYWQRSFAKLALEAYNCPSTEKNHPIYDDIAFLQYIGYHSTHYRHTTKFNHLPSALFRNLLVKYLVTKTDKTFLILRSESFWKEVIGEEGWNRLNDEGRLITKGHKGMSQSISRGNLKKDDGFDKLVEILRQ